MLIKDQITADATTALKAGDRLRLSVVRTVRAQIKNAEIDKGHELSDEETIDVIVSAVKARRESLDYASKGERDDLVQQAQQELQILESYLPQQLTEDEIKGIVEAAIHDVGPESMKDMGRVMGAVMPQVKGRADGKLVNTLVRSSLQALLG